MPKASICIDIPDGWELACETLRKPLRGEHVAQWIDLDGSPTILAVNSTALFGLSVIVRKTWKWPEWLTARWVFQWPSGEWHATNARPTLGNTYWYFCDSNATTSSLSMTTLEPPACDDWRRSLRENPNWRPTNEG